jgi:arginyl-tRNA synthetase
MIKQEIANLIKASIKKLQKEGEFPEFDIPEILVERPKEKARGDYATNVAMALAKRFGQSPMKAANLLCDRLRKDNLFQGKGRAKGKVFGKVEAVPPGFINFFLPQKVLLSDLAKILKEKGKYGRSKTGKGKTIIIDYSSVNIAKPFGIGHLRSTIIGQAIYNLYEFLGYKTIGDNHIGDWGTQFGKLICAVKKWGNEKKIAEDPVKNLVGLYVKFHKEAEKNPQLEEEGRKWFKKLEQGDKEARILWKKCVKWSLKEFERVYKILGVKIDLALGESFYEPMLKDIVKEALDKKIAIKSRGAVIIPYPRDVLPPLMIRKSDGATLYSTRDLAAIKYRRKRFKPYKIIYEVGADQTLYFKQLFWAAELLGWGKREDYIHIAHGMMRLAAGRMRTRKGEIILLEDVLKEASERAKRIVEEKNPKIGAKKKEKIAEIIGIGAVKYNNLSRRPLVDIVFKWDNALSLEGNSGPYLQYAYARAKSIIRRSKVKTIKLGKGEFKEEEIRLLRQLIRFPEIVGQAAETYSPNLVCNYIFGLAQDFNSFYEAVPVLKAEDNNLMMARLALVEATAQIIKNGLALLGIKTLERM